jgi:hypothetical protein
MSVPGSEFEYTVENPEAVPEGGVFDGIAVNYGDDGQIIVEDSMAPQQVGEPSQEFDANLALEISEEKLKSIGQDVVDWVKADIESRKDWAARFKNGMMLMGVMDDPVPTLDIDGASTATHPLIGMAVVQFQARAMEELMPPTGPVKVTIHGAVTEELERAATRVEFDMNKQLMVDDPDYYDDTDQMLFYLPWNGSTFKKVFYDDILGVNTARFIAAHDLIVPYDAKRLSDAPRITHRYKLNSIDVEAHMDSGAWRRVALNEPTGQDPEDEIQEMIDKADDRTDVTHPEDLRHRFYETHCHYDLGLGEGSKPYRIVVEQDSQEIVEIKRNWRESDPKARRREWFVHYKFLPGTGFYGFGFIHIIGSLANATTGALRALFDAAAAASFQGGFSPKDGVKNDKGEFRLKFGTWTKIDASYEDLQKSFFTPPFKEPSNALLNLFNALVEAGRSFASTTEAMVGEANNNAPVGTTLALIEQGSKVFSGIHRRLHAAQRREFRAIATLNGENKPDLYAFSLPDEEKILLREDYNRLEIEPVSDPNIFSQTQRLTIAQSVYELATQNPDVLDRRQAVVKLLKSMRAPDAEHIIIPEQKPQQLDPLSENEAMYKGQPVQARPGEDHDAHLMVHRFALEQALVTKELSDKVGPIQAHVAEHLGLQMREKVEMMLGQPLPPNAPLEIQNQIALVTAKAIEAIKQDQPMPPDPEMEKAMAEIKRKDDLAAAEIERKDALASAEIERKGALTQADVEMREAKTHADMMRDDTRTVADMEREDMRDEREERRDALPK